MVRLAAGEHRISGRFTWPQRPDRLQLPTEVALISASLNGTALEQPRLDPQGGLWLRDARSDEPRQGPDALSLEVARRIEDSVPLRLESPLPARHIASGDPPTAGLAPDQGLDQGPSPTEHAYGLQV